jgi:hypothetical protein
MISNNAELQELYLKQKFEVESIDQAEGITANYEFVVKDDGFDVLIVVSENLKEIEAKTKYKISKELHRTIHSHLILNESYVEGRQEQINDGIAKAQQNLVKAVHKLVDLMEFEAGYLFLSENLRQGNCYCSLNGEHWEDVKKRECTAHFTSSWNNIPGLNEFEKAAIQSHIDNTVEPFLASHHLYKAKKESDPRYQLMNIALALELGIKEYLVRKKPDIEVEVLINELPSPSLDKLYGIVLQSFAKQKTPVKMDIIQEISKKRNRLVHRVIKSAEENANKAEIKKFLKATEIALFHLWLDLYPYDESTSIRYKSLLDANPSLINRIKLSHYANPTSPAKTAR